MTRALYRGYLSIGFLRDSGQGGRDGLSQSDIFFLVPERGIKTTGGLIGCAGFEREVREAVSRCPALGGRHQLRRDALAFLAGCHDQFPDVGVDLAGEMSPRPR